MKWSACEWKNNVAVKLGRWLYICVYIYIYIRLRGNSAALVVVAALISLRCIKANIFFAVRIVDAVSDAAAR